MADRKAVAAGNWSDTSKWDGGTLPQAGDVVYLNNFAITLDQDVNVAQITNLAGGTVAAAAGGSITANTTRSITANLVPGATGLLTYSGNASTTLTLIGNVGSGTGAGAAVTSTGGGTIAHSGGNIAGGTSSHGFLVTGGGALSTTGNVAGGGANSCYGIYVTTVAMTIAVAGTVTGGTGGTTAHGILIGIAGCTLTIGTVGSPSGVSSTNNGQGINVVNSTVTIYGPVNATGSQAAVNTAGNLTINGDMTGTVGNAVSWAGVNSGQSMTLVGNILAVLGVGVSIAAGALGSVTHTGNVTGGTAASAHGLSILTANNVPTTVNGNVTGGSSTGNGINHGGTTLLLTVNGNAQGGTASTAVGISVATTGNCTLNGNAVGGTLAANYGWSAAAAGVMTHNGIAMGSNSGTGAGNGAFVGTTVNNFIQCVRANNYPNDGLTVASAGVTGTSAVGAVTVDSMEDGTGGYQAVQVIRAFVRAIGTNYVKSYNTSGGSVVMMGEVADYPAEADVRHPVAYASGSKTGSCRVPPAGSVALGVPVDGGAGTAALTPNALLGADLLARLQQCATVETTGDQLAAFTS